MNFQSQKDQKDIDLQNMLVLLNNEGIALKWGGIDHPYTDLQNELNLISNNQEFMIRFNEYLANNEFIPLTVQNLLAHISVSAFAQREAVPYPTRFLATDGIRIGRWLPTFLTINGPIGRFLTKSPLKDILQQDWEKYPSLAQARDLFSHDKFRLIRNGFAHWAFSFEKVDHKELIVCFDEASGKRTIVLQTEVIEALFLTSFFIIEGLDRYIFKSFDSQTDTIS